MEPVVARSSNELALKRTDLAVFRTALAASRSLMAWVRTALSMIGFGFTLYKFLEGFAGQIRPNAPRNAGLFLIGLGTLSVLFGCLEYWEISRDMRRNYQKTMRGFPLLMAILVALLGVVLFLGVVFRLT
jgi:putative membrane protein